MTIGQIVITVFLGICGIVWVTFNFYDHEITKGILSFIVVVVVITGISFGCTWYNQNTASGIRSYKDFKSNFDNGIDREIKITAEDGREIFYYEGKVDIELDHDDNYIKFETPEGKRYIIVYGITDTVAIIEK